MTASKQDVQLGRIKDFITEKNFPGGKVVKNPPANAGYAGDRGSTLGREDPLEEGMATHSSILGCKVPWTEEPRGLQSMVLRKSQT